MGDVAEQIRGVTYSKDEAAAAPRPGYVPILRANNITDYGLDFEDLVYVPGSRVSRKQSLQAGDVVIAASSGSLDVVGKASGFHDGFHGSFGAFCKVLRPNKSSVDLGYFSHYFRTRSYRRTISALAAGANINNLKNEHLNDLEIPLPPLDEQRRIAAILDKADALRRKRKRALELLDGLRQSIFLEIFGDFTKHKTIRFDETLSRPLRNGISPSKAGKVAAKVLTLSAVTGGSFKPQASKEATFDVSPAQDLRVQKEDFLICRGNGNKSMVGMGVVCPISMPDTAFPDTIIAAKIDYNKFQPHYLEEIWRSVIVRRQIEQSVRTTNGTFKVNQTMLEGISLPNPPLSLQKEYGARVAVIKDTANTHEAQLSALDLLFSSLQHRAFTGRL